MAFGAADGAPGKMSELPSGLKYTDSKVGDGATATAGHKVSVHYTGWLYNNGEKGKKFDSSVDRGQPFSFGLGAQQVIRGWDEGVAGMKVGGKRTLVIPPELGYGAREIGRASCRERVCAWVVGVWVRAKWRVTGGRR